MDTPEDLIEGQFTIFSDGLLAANCSWLADKMAIYQNVDMSLPQDLNLG